MSTHVNYSPQPPSIKQISIPPEIFYNILGAIVKQFKDDLVDLVSGKNETERKELYVKALKFINDLELKVVQLRREIGFREAKIYVLENQLRMVISPHGEHKISEASSYISLDGEKIEVYKPLKAYDVVVSEHEAKCSCPQAIRITSSAEKYIRYHYRLDYRRIKTDTVAKYSLCKHVLYTLVFYTILYGGIPKELRQKLLLVFLLGNNIKVNREKLKLLYVTPSKELKEKRIIYKSKVKKKTIAKSKLKPHKQRKWKKKR